MTAAPLAESLLAWSDRTRRDLPWRRTRDPWAILVSETMLQQTQVARVIGPFLAFMDRWPDPTALA
ncbi:MAG: A/G-specific adenine glycosylase, partial [Actinomycetota bacterium]|nr:A/G-specific adenine glycosylase [Actinomycetota bacterium]